MSLVEKIGHELYRLKGTDRIFVDHRTLVLTSPFGAEPDDEVDSRAESISIPFGSQAAALLALKIIAEHVYDLGQARQGADQMRGFPFMPDKV